MYVCISVCVFIRCISNLPYHACCCSTVTFAHANFSAASALLHLVRSNQKKTMCSSNESKEAGLACVFPRDYYFPGIILIVWTDMMFAREKQAWSCRAPSKSCTAALWQVRIWTAMRFVICAVWPLLFSLTIGAVNKCEMSCDATGGCAARVLAGCDCVVDPLCDFVAMPFQSFFFIVLVLQSA